MRIKEGFLAYVDLIYGSRSKKFVLLNAAFLLGVSFASLLHIGRSLILVIYVCMWILLLICFLVSRRALRIIMSIAIFGVFFGSIRFVFSEPRNVSTNIKFYNGFFATFQGFIISSPSSSFNQKQKLLIAVKNLESVNNKFISLPPKVNGTVAVYIPQFPERNLGDELRINCVLQDPKDFGKGLQTESLYKNNVWSVCDATRVEYLGQHSFGKAFTLLNTFRTRVDKQVSMLFNEPYAGLLGGILYGARTNVSLQLLTDFQRTGLSHIMAISGYNITIMVTTIAILSMYIGLRRQHAFWAITIFIILFVIFTGASASIIRAGLMGFFVLLARKAGRVGSIHRVLLFSASVLVLINPRVLWFDIGFQLSYLATIGLVYGVPILEKRFTRIPNMFGLKEIMLSTSAALIATTPLILYQFGRFSLIAPITNLLVLPFIPIIMAFGFAAIALSFVWMPLGTILAWITWIPLAYVVNVVSSLSSLNFASFSLRIPLFVVILYYLAIFYLILLNYKTSSKQHI